MSTPTCDRCDAPAYVRATDVLTDLYLDFCLHHYKEFTPHLSEWIIDVDKKSRCECNYCGGSYSAVPK